MINREYKIVSIECLFTIILVVKKSRQMQLYSYGEYMSNNNKLIQIVKYLNMFTHEYIKQIDI